MIPTYNGCSRSKFYIYPKNWNTARASTKKPWRIFYRFYDPAFGDDPKKKAYLVPLRGMNHYHTLPERQGITKALIKNEIELLEERGYNPITGQFMIMPDENQLEISPTTPFCKALWKAFDKVQVVPGTKTDIRSVVNAVENACSKLYDSKYYCRYESLVISQVSRRHIKSLLDYIGQNNPRWSNNRFNKYKAYLSMLFKELIEIEATEINPCRDLASKKKIKKLRAILTPDEEIRIDQHLKANHYYFWRFVRLFFDSQARETEMIQLRKDSGVRIDQQEFNVIVRKGKETKESVRVISAEMIPLWKEVWNEAKPGQYLFSKYLKPGVQKIRPDQIGRRWFKYVKQPIEKGGLGINKDFYSLKHLSLDKMDSMYGIYLASAGAGHTNTNTTISHYAVGHQNRALMKLKMKKVSFGG